MFKKSFRRHVSLISYTFIQLQQYTAPFVCQTGKKNEIAPAKSSQNEATDCILTLSSDDLFRRDLSPVNRRSSRIKSQSESSLWVQKLQKVCRKSEISQFYVQVRQATSWFKCKNQKATQILKQKYTSINKASSEQVTRIANVFSPVWIIRPTGLLEVLTAILPLHPMALQEKSEQVTTFL